MHSNSNSNSNRIWISIMLWVLASVSCSISEVALADSHPAKEMYICDADGIWGYYDEWYYKRERSREQYRNYIGTEELYYTPSADAIEARELSRRAAQILHRLRYD